MAVIVEDPVTALRAHAERLNARLLDTERLLRAILLTVCETSGAPVRVSNQLLLSADINVRVDMASDPATNDVLYYAYRR